MTAARRIRMVGVLALIALVGAGCGHTVTTSTPAVSACYRVIPAAKQAAAAAGAQGPLVGVQRARPATVNAALARVGVHDQPLAGRADVCVLSYRLAPARTGAAPAGTLEPSVRGAAVVVVLDYRRAQVRKVAKVDSLPPELR